jgi:alpha/beta superfamily hydrolase
MSPFYFGDRRRRLFGIYDPALSIGGAARAAVICHPWGNEQIHAYRTLRQLASRLSQVGFHVLRFDYYGTGDSGGNMSDNDFAGSRSDVETAIAEMKDLTGVGRLSLVGLRLGACLAAEVAAARAGEIDALVLWDPLTAYDLAPAAVSQAVAGSLPAGAGADLEVPRNFGLTNFFALSKELPHRTLVVLSQEEEAASLGPLQVEHVPGAPVWLEEPMMTGAIPVGALQRIVHWLR